MQYEFPRIVLRLMLDIGKVIPQECTSDWDSNYLFIPIKLCSMMRDEAVVVTTEEK